MDNNTTISPTTYLPMVVEASEQTNIGETIIDAEIITEDTRSPFIEANSIPITLESLQNDCVIPNFAKDNEAVISHSQFIGATYQALKDYYRSEQIDEPQIRVSHIIRGRIPEAINKKSSELLPHEMTQYYERMAFCINVPTIYQDVNGNRLQLSIVGVKSYGRDNLNGKLTAQKFSIAVGFQNTVCCNQCIWTDGYRDDIRAISPGEIYQHTLSLLDTYDMAKHIYLLQSLGDLYLSETQFALILGKMRLYNYLPQRIQRGIPEMLITDSMVNNIARQYYRDPNFKVADSGELSMWDFYNLLTGACKGSYIDTFLSRQANALTTSLGIAEGLRNEDSGYSWFIN
jgi:hypothetical protein